MGERLWETGSADYCRACRQEAGQPCDDCPAPTLLPELACWARLWERCRTQWQFAGMGRRTGLRYEAVIAVMGLMEAAGELQDPPTQLLDHVQLAELTQLQVDEENHGSQN